MVHVTKSITVSCPRQQLFQAWRHLENLPRFMEHAEITDEQPNEFLAWRSRKGSGGQNLGSVRLRDAPADRGTEIEVDLQYETKGGKLAARLADDLRRLKQVIEIGEVTR